MTDASRVNFTGDVSLGQVLLVLSIVVPVLVYYFGGEASTTDRINQVDATLSDRISKVETRVAVVEQHQIETDSAVADERNQLNAFTVEVRSALAKISDQINELRPLITNRTPEGARRR